VDGINFSIRSFEAGQWPARLPHPANSADRDVRTWATECTTWPRERSDELPRDLQTDLTRFLAVVGLMKPPYKWFRQRSPHTAINNLDRCANPLDTDSCGISCFASSPSARDVDSGVIGDRRTEERTSLFWSRLECNYVDAMTLGLPPSERGSE